MAAAAVENNAECPLGMFLVAALLLLLVLTGASADRLHDGGWEKANTTPDGQHDELATAAAAMATAITEVLFDDMLIEGIMSCYVLAMLLCVFF